MKHQKWIFQVLFIGLLAAGCANLTGQPIASPLTEQTAKPVTDTPFVNTSPTPPPVITPTLPAAGTPTPLSTNGPETIELGEPSWIGRGRMMAAVFLPGAKQVAIAWGSGVSLNLVESGEELWFQPTPTNLVAFDVGPQAQVFAAALSDGSVMTFEAGDGESRRFEGARPNAYWGDLAWSPDGRTIAFQFIGPNRSDPIYLLEVGSGKISQVPHSQTGEGVGPALVWSPDGSAISVAALGEMCPRFVDVRTGQERMTLGVPGGCYPVLGLLFLPDGQMAVVNRQANGLDLLQFPDGERIRTLARAENVLAGGLIEFPAVSGSLFTDPRGKWIASRGGYEPCHCGNPQDRPYHPLIVWDLASGAVKAQLERAVEPLAERHRLAAAFDGEEIVMLYESGEITRWAFNDPQAGESVVARVPVRPVSAWALRWSADGSHIAFTGRYGGVDVYETAGQQLVRRFDPPLASPALSPDGSLVALYDPDQRAEVIYEVRSGQVLRKLPATPVLMGAAFSPDGRYLAYGDGARAAVAEVASAETELLDPAPATPVRADMAVSRLIWSPDGKALATVFGLAGGDSLGPGVIVLWKRLGEGSFEAVYHLPNVQANYPLPNQVLAIFNPSGSRVAMKSLPAFEAGQTKLVVYDLERDKVILTLEEYTPGAWMNDDELLAAEAQYDTRLTRLNVVSGEKTVGRGVDHGDNVYAPGGIFYAQMAEPPGRGVTVRHWRSNAVVARLDHASLNLLDYSWSPDGHWLASIGDDGTLRISSVSMPAAPTSATLPGPTQTQAPAPSDETLLLPSPDGLWTAILDRQAGSLELEDAQGVKHALFPEGSAVNDAKWSPDSLRLAVALSNPPRPAQSPEEIGIAEIWLVTVIQNGLGEPRPVRAPEPSDDDAGAWITFGAWSPDSSRLLFWPGPLSASIQADGLPLWSLEVETGQAIRLAETALVNQAYQSWAPDGRALVFTNGGYRSAQVGKWLSLYEVGTSQVTILLPEQELVPGQVAWSPAGGEIAFAAVEAGQTGWDWADWMGWDNPAIQARRIYLLDPQSGEYRRLNQAGSYQDAPRWSEDGKRLYYVQMEGDQAVILAADPRSGEAQPLPGCRAPRPPAAGYYGQVDWSEWYASCPQAGG